MHNEIWQSIKYSIILKENNWFEQRQQILARENREYCTKFAIYEYEIYITLTYCTLSAHPVIELVWTLE